MIHLSSNRGVSSHQMNPFCVPRLVWRTLAHFVSIHCGHERLEKVCTEIPDLKILPGDTGWAMGVFGSIPGRHKVLSSGPPAEDHGSWPRHSAVST